MTVDTNLRRPFAFTFICFTNRKISVLKMLFGTQHHVVDECIFRNNLHNIVMLTTYWLDREVPQSTITSGDVNV